MVSDRMPRLSDSPDKLRMGLSSLSDHEKCRVRSIPFEDVE
jgi:hypothetical protein